MGQAFPLYLRLTGGVNRFGVVLGLVSLLVAWFTALAHVLLFGCYVNVSLQQRHDAPGNSGIPDQPVQLDGKRSDRPSIRPRRHQGQRRTARRATAHRVEQRHIERRPAI
jgi:uncharacterized BrkB/YihY/UPF0761 family membrane protein